MICKSIYDPKYRNFTRKIITIIIIIIVWWLGLEDKEVNVDIIIQV